MKSRKERFAYFSMVGVFIMGGLGVLAGQPLAICIIGIFGSYMGGNVGEHFAKAKKQVEPSS